MTGYSIAYLNTWGSPTTPPPHSPSLIYYYYVRVYPLTIDATPLNNNSFFPKTTGNNSSNSTLINDDNLNETRNLTQQDSQTPSHFVTEEIVEAITTTEAQLSISPIPPNFTTPKLKNPTLQQTIIQFTVKSSVTQKYYKTFRPVTKPSYTQKLHRKHFAEHNYIITI